MLRVIFLTSLLTFACTSSKNAKKSVIKYSLADPFSTINVTIEKEDKLPVEKKTSSDYILDTNNSKTIEKIIVDGYDARGQNPKIKELQLKPYPLAKVEIEEIYTPTKYVVKENENLYSIVKKFNISFSSLIKLNQLKQPYTVFVGQNLILPQPARHKVAFGQTLSDIAKIYSVFVSDLVKANKFDKNNINILVGQEIVIPAKFSNNLPFAQVSKFEDDFFSKTEEDLSANLASKSPTQNSKIITNPKLSRVNNKSRKNNITNFRLLPSVPDLDGGRFARPIKGKIVEKFGKIKFGMKIQGVTFISQPKANVYATENGVVVYTDNAIKSYGNMVILKHGQNYTSAYGYLANFNVKRGDIVRKGQTIAKLGSNYKASQPQLYFEIRKNTTTINPETLIANK